MSHRHDPVRVSRRAALGAAAAAGAALGGAGNALAAPSPTDPGGPANDPYFVTESTRRAGDRPGTDHTRHPLREPRRNRLQADLRHRGVLVALGVRAAAPRQRSTYHGARRAPARCPDHRDGRLRDASRHRQHRRAPRVPSLVGGEHQRRLQRRTRSTPTRSRHLPLVRTAVRRGVAGDDRRGRRRGRGGVLRHRQHAGRHRASPLGRADRVRHGRRRSVLPDRPGPRLRLACRGSPSRACSVRTPVA